MSRPSLWTGVFFFTGIYQSGDFLKEHKYTNAKGGAPGQNEYNCSIIYAQFWTQIYCVLIIFGCIKRETKLEQNKYLVSNTRTSMNRLTSHSPGCAFPLESSTPDPASPCNNITWQISESQTDLSKCAWVYNIDAHTQHSMTKLLLDKVIKAKGSLTQTRIAKAVAVGSQNLYSQFPTSQVGALNMTLLALLNLLKNWLCRWTIFKILSIPQCRKEKIILKIR